jgi:3-hydroxyisobutyrate dehydrogenase-like beta-hydroxyacid dehydrogenase
MNRLGFIGMGAMGSAIASGLIASKQMEGKNILAYAPHKEKLIASADRIGFMPIGAPDKLVADVDTVLIACKPYQIKDVLSADIVGALKGKNTAFHSCRMEYRCVQRDTGGRDRDPVHNAQYAGTDRRRGIFI